MYIQMPIRRTTRTIAEARSELPRLVHEVERGRTVEITRRGRPVAVLVSVDDHRRLSGEAPSFDALYQAWLDGVEPAARGTDRAHWRRLRDRQPGRAVAL